MKCNGICSKCKNKHLEVKAEEPKKETYIVKTKRNKLLAIPLKQKEDK